MSKPTLWTRDFIIVSVLNFLLILVFYLLMVVMGLFATEQLQASPSQAGLVAGIFIVGVLAGRLLIGQFMARIGCKRSMLSGLFLGAFASLFYFVDADLSFLITIRFLHGVSVGIAATAIATVVAYLIPVSRSGEGIGYFGVSASLATAVGPFIGIYMLQHTEFAAILALCCMLSAVCVAVGLLLNVPEVNKEGEGSQPAKFALGNFIELKVVPICCIVFISGLYYSSVLSFLNMYALEKNLTDAASLFFVVYAVTLLVTRPYTGKLMDRKGENVVMYPGFILMALGLAALGMAESGSQLLLAAFLLALGFGSMQSCSQAIVIQMVSRERLALATSTFFIFVDAGLGFGPYILGLAVPSFGYANLYCLLSLFTLFSAVAYYFVHGKSQLALRS